MSSFGLVQGSILHRQVENGMSVSSFDDYYLLFVFYKIFPLNNRWFSSLTHILDKMRKIKFIVH